MLFGIYSIGEQANMRISTSLCEGDRWKLRFLRLSSLCHYVHVQLRHDRAVKVTNRNLLVLLAEWV